jgi:Bacterial PH domain
VSRKEIAVGSPQWMDGKTVYANPGLRLVAVFYPLFSLVPAGFVGGRGTVAAIFGAVVLVASVTVFSVRIARMAVIAEDDGVTVRNAWRSWRCPWTEVRGFEVPGSPLFPMAVPRMLCTSGRRIRLWGLLVGRGGLVWDSGGLWGQDWAEEQVAFLKQEVEQRRPPTHGFVGPA